MPNVTINGESFEAERGTSILDAAAASSKVIAYSCRTGRCSTCKCKVLEGETVALAAETGLTAGEKADGWILSCVRAAVTDVTLEADVLDGLALPSTRTFPCRISRIDKLAPEAHGEASGETLRRLRGTGDPPW